MDEKIVIPIYRGGNIVSSLGNSFGGSLRETRLTAIVGYLINITPCGLCRRVLHFLSTKAIFEAI